VARKKQWKDLSPGAKRAIVAGGVLEAILTTISLRDLTRRPRPEVRGPKLLWVLGCFVQPFGPVLYLLVGRRPASR
jgi:hypothetical protein